MSNLSNEYATRSKDDITSENVSLRERIAQLEERVAERDEGRPRFETIFIASLPVLLLLVLGFERRWTTDDAFIDFRVVSQILAGHGPVYNIGQRVEAYTSPLWVALLTVWSIFGGSIEVGSVALGLILSGSGLTLGLFASWQLIQRKHDRERLSRASTVLPIGAIVFVVVPAVWDFTTSGLETGMIFGWLGFSFWLISRQCLGDAKREANRQQSEVLSPSLIVTAIIVGLGPLIRPDLLFFSLTFLGALIFVHFQEKQGERRWGSWVTLLIVAGALPVAYEIFRMGYFANLEPNTALAKEGTAVDWFHGGGYLGDFIETYVLWVPILGMGCFWSSSFLRSWSSHDWPSLTVWLAPVVGASVDAIYVVRVGGDFMHARFLLPSFFGFLLPLLFVEVHTFRPVTSWTDFVVASLAAWSVVCAAWLRVPYQGIGPNDIADEHNYYVTNAHQAHPVTVSDHRADPYAANGLTIHQESLAQHRVFIPENDLPGLITGHAVPMAAWLPTSINLVTSNHFIGMAGFNAGTDVFFVDRFGLADPIASRFLVGLRRGRPGHEKDMSGAWVIAHYAGANVSANDPDVAAARSALACGDLNTLLHAIEDPLTPARFLRNLTLAPRLTTLRFSAHPREAQQQLCGL